MTTRYYIGHATDPDVRHKASSGGVGTAVTRHLLEQPEYGTALTFYFDQETCQYKPKLAYKADDFNMCGSIYQDMDLPRFIRDNIKQIKEGIVVTCAPCQVGPVKSLLKRNGKKGFIISFCCSGQTTTEGTWCLYKFLGIDKQQVSHIQYRGNGWPSGIQITLKNGDRIFRENYTEPWKTIHKSMLFRPKRCHFCKLDTGHNADIAIADPWLPKYIQCDTEGATMLLVNSDLGKDVMDEMVAQQKIELTDSCYDEYAIAQKPNIQKELFVKDNPRFVRWRATLTGKGWYRRWAASSMRNMKRHIKLTSYLNAISSIHKIQMLPHKIYSRIANRIRFYKLRGRLGGYKNNFNIMGGGRNAEP